MDDNICLIDIQMVLREHDRGLGCECRRFEVPAACAANASGNFKWKSGTGIMDLLVPLKLAKFVLEGAEMVRELPKRGTREPGPAKEL